MFNKILVWAGIFIAVIQLIANFVWMQLQKLFVFVIQVTPPTLVFFCIIIWMMIWFWLKWMMTTEKFDDSDNDF